MTKQLTKRDVLKGAGALGLSAFAVRVVAAPAAEAVTPALIEAAKKEGKLSFYTAMDLQFAERLGKAFEAKFPGIVVRVERSGAERVFTRIDQEYSSNIHAVDVVNTADQAHCIIWKRSGWLAPYLPEEVVRHFDKRYYDPEGLHVTTRILISPLAYNTNLVKKEDAPKSFKDLLDPKWVGKLVKAHPAYSGTIMNATFEIARHAGPVGDRYAEEDITRRTRGHGGRRGLPCHPLQGGGPASRHHLSGGGHAACHQSKRGL